MKLFRIKESLEDLHEQAEYWNGYDREKAVKRLGNIGASSSIPVLLRRVNDWVPQVRHAAKESLLSLCTEGNVEAFVHQLPNVFHLKNCGREDHEALISNIVDYLLDSDHQKSILENIRNSDRKIARLCLNLSIENKLETPEKLIQRGFKHQDVIVRSMAFELFKPALEGISKPLIEIAQHDSFMPIRREILRLVWETSMDAEMAKGFLFDKHASVRALATRLLQDGGLRSEVETQYIDEIEFSTSIHQTRCAIWGVGHLKLTQHTSHVLRQLDSIYSSVRKQALISLDNVDDNNIENILEERLYDMSPSVRKQSIRFHELREISYNADQLLVLQQNATDKESADSCFSVSSLSSRWERLIFFLSLLDSKHSTKLESGFVESAISSWGADGNRVAISPTLNQTIRLRNLVEDNPIVYDLNSRLSFLLRTFGVLEDS